MRRLTRQVLHRILSILTLFFIFTVSSILLSSYTNAELVPPELTPEPTEEVSILQRISITQVPVPLDNAEPEYQPLPVSETEPLTQTEPDRESPVAESNTEPDNESICEAPPRFRDAFGNPVYDYSYGDCVPEGNAADDTFFADTVFLGDSRTEGFRLYSGLKYADIYAAKSITVMNIFNEKVINDGEGGYRTILESIKGRPYSKVYIMLGINEIGLDPDVHYSLYSVLIDEIRSLQPNADIYIQAVIPVSQSKHESDSVINNTRIGMYNQKFRELAVEKGLHFIDTYTALLNDDGYLPDDASFDGVHLYKEYCEKWLQYLKTHTIVSTGVAEGVS